MKKLLLILLIGTIVNAASPIEIDDLKTVNIARANYIGNSLLKDTMFNSLIDIFVDNIYDHQG